MNISILFEKFKTQTIIMIFGVILVVFVFAYAFFTLFVPSSYPPVSTNPSPTAIEKLNKISSYLNTVPGKTTKAEVEKIPNLKQSIQLSNGNLQYSFFSPNPLNDNLVVVKDDIVAFEKTVTVAPDYKHPRLSDYFTNYGEAEEKIVGSKRNGVFETFYVFASKGFTLIGNPYTDEINEIQVYEPTTIKNYKILWGEDITPSKTKENL